MLYKQNFGEENHKLTESLAQCQRLLKAAHEEARERGEEAVQAEHKFRELQVCSAVCVRL